MRRAAATLALLLALAPVAAGAGAAQVEIPAGSYVPFAGGTVKTGEGAFAIRPPVEVAAFRLDVHPVTNADFAAFVAAECRWRRGRVPSLFAEDGYLAHWAGELEPGGAGERAPVTNVSWFAARAYCEWRGGRLPTLDEWEYAAHDAGRDAEAVRRGLLEWHARPNPPRLAEVGSAGVNGYGVADLHGLVWEWVLDWNAVLAGGESRSADDEELFCGAGAADARDTADYPAFLRHSMRASLRGAYTLPNLGFRCAGDAR